LGMAAAALGACAGGPAVGPTASAAPDPAMRPVPNPGFDAWVAGFRPRALGQGVSPATFDAAFAGAGFLPGVIERDRNQTEFTRTLEDYLAIAASDERVAKGQAALRQYGPLLAEIEARYGVEPQVVVAVWGLESFYGERRGDVEVISALATLAYEGRRGTFFEQHMVAALRILQNGDVAAPAMTGSWAGAMGHTQFIPTSYLAYAVDFRGDGRRDIWSDDPTDALASAAAYLSRSGWRRGQPWGREVTPGASTAGGRVLVPQPGGPAFVVYSNFSVILRYNNSENYAIGIGHLSDRLAGGPPIRGPFPPDAAGMTIADRRELQARLTAAGFDTEGADGVIGQRTRDAISAYQAQAGLAVTGEPSVGLLAGLR
jgi:membrane-bound lytic murein transglycosylase B